MPRAKQTASKFHLDDPQYYLNRELSWLEFNRRVLHEAIDIRTPLLERIKFTAIFSANLDEFFMVRVAILREQVEAQVGTLTPDGRTPEQQLAEISQQLRPMLVQQHQLFEQDLRPQLAKNSIHILNYIDLSQDQQTYLHQYFEKRIFPVLTPLAVDPAHPFPQMSNLSLNLAVVIKDPDTGEQDFARVKVPSNLSRFVTFPKELQQYKGESCLWLGVPLEQVIAHNLSLLFPGMEIQEYYPFRVTRDADLDVQEYEADDLLLAIEQELRKRLRGGSVLRLQIPTSTSEFVRQKLMQGMSLTELEVYETEGLLGLKDLMTLTAIPCPSLKDSPWTPVIPARLKGLAPQLDTRIDADDRGDGLDIFSVIQQQDLLVHHPYESFTASVETFITHAATDPDVLAIKMTLYRTSGDTLPKALMQAAENGKQVVVLVELKARFDEENNINWARRLEDAGVHVVYGLVGFKTHTKVVLVVRQEADQIRRYVHIGTGNYSPKTAKLYTDLGLLSCREDLGADLTDLFNYLTGFSKQRSYRKLLISPMTMRDRITAMIRREIQHCQQGQPGRIIAKMNSLTDVEMIRTLYEASQAGVQIDLIVRGMCCLRPGISGISDNIRVVSIVGRFLEHSRIFYFHNNEETELYLGSADWMRRNLDRRVEAVTPIEDPSIKHTLTDTLHLLLSDTRQAWLLHADGRYTQLRPQENEAECSAQQRLMELTQHH
ncbi:polyphosphate kinase 1 [Leptolyngbya sp. GGD]|uniref:polyphosphate kinase 1 n=1 Tax=Leptolyngbya sp. GGD TaxID=2997907 RepID=UPI00227A72CC|nr:polyphosphate kinase 1 [Leptolyngbya sp. GGD]MCY6489616.1 polyphosphate kinase 1 [Leptolyngbya sp. GGD]